MSSRTKRCVLRGISLGFTTFVRIIDLPSGENVLKDTKIDGITIVEWEKRYNAPVEPESGAESESEDEDETSLDSEIRRLRNFSAKQWTQFLRGRTFESEGTNTITAVVYRGKKYGYVIEVEDEDGKYDEYFQKVILDLAKGEDWVTDALRTVARDKKFSSKG